jgi:secreted Zn-dependent insulinase-like peptidase
MSEEKKTAVELYKEEKLKVQEKLKGMNHQEKLTYLDDLVLDKYVESLVLGEIEAGDLGNIVGYLKNNKVVQDVKPVRSESEEIEDLVEEKTK